MKALLCTVMAIVSAVAYASDRELVAAEYGNAVTYFSIGEVLSPIDVIQRMEDVGYPFQMQAPLFSSRNDDHNVLSVYDKEKPISTIYESEYVKQSTGGKIKLVVLLDQEKRVISTEHRFHFDSKTQCVSELYKKQDEATDSGKLTMENDDKLKISFYDHCRKGGIFTLAVTSVD
tara:strand:+ start:1780 stop:2304 length:525 start_codon:yes stop_codon:yes gene_type:complete